MNRITQVFGANQWAWAVNLVGANVLFGWGHTEQRESGWMQEGISGFLLGALFLTACRNLVVPVIAHGVSNSLALNILGAIRGLARMGHDNTLQVNLGAGPTRDDKQEW